MARILLLQGANMAYLGRRVPELYGTTSAAELDALLARHAERHGYDLDIFYTHVEGEAIGRLYRAVDEGCDGLVMNPAGFLYAGHALLDCLRAVTRSYPFIEIHMTSPDARKVRSVTAEAARGVIAGFGIGSYILGLEAMLRLLDGSLDRLAES